MCFTQTCSQRLATGSSDHWKVKKNLTYNQLSGGRNGTQNSYALARNVRIHLTADLAGWICNSPRSATPARLELHLQVLILNADDPLVVINIRPKRSMAPRNCAPLHHHFIKVQNTSITYRTHHAKKEVRFTVLNNGPVAEYSPGTKNRRRLPLSAWGSHHLVIHNF